MSKLLFIGALPDDREIYGFGLRTLGHEVLFADAGEAVSAARTARPSAIILHIAQGDHWDIGDALRQTCGDIPVIVLTAAVRPDRQNRVRARQTANCAAFVGKPCTPDGLALVIDRVSSGERQIELASGLDCG